MDQAIHLPVGACPSRVMNGSLPGCKLRSIIRGMLGDLALAVLIREMRAESHVSLCDRATSA